MNVKRYPYSFQGDNPSGGVGRTEGNERTWHESLLGYCGGDPKTRDNAEETMRQLGRRAGIELDYNVKTNWQPIDSQRLMIWARQFGKAEKYMSALARRHFEERNSASHRTTLLDAAEEAGLDVVAAREFLDTDELRQEVWKSYGDTIHEKGIRAIPYFVFNSTLTNGGPFRDGPGKPIVVNGSGDEQEFLSIFEQLFREVERGGAL
jgi:predicted DsbA family dithiol-disulfide isomerase